MRGRTRGAVLLHARLLVRGALALLPRSRTTIACPPQAKKLGIRNILALRGDPPKGEESFTAIEGGFSCALDLVKYIRQAGFERAPLWNGTGMWSGGRSEKQRPHFFGGEGGGMNTAVPPAAMAQSESDGPDSRGGSRGIRARAGHDPLPRRIRVPAGRSMAITLASVSAATQRRTRTPSWTTPSW